MSNVTGVIERWDVKMSRAGKPYCKAKIDGSEYLVFAKTLEANPGIGIGSEVEFSHKTSDNGDSEVITYLKAKGGAAKALQQSQQSPVWRGTTPADRESIEKSVVFKAAVDLVASGTVSLPAGGHPNTVADIVSTTAKELLRHFRLLGVAAPDSPKPAPAKPAEVEDAADPT